MRYIRSFQSEVHGWRKQGRDWQTLSYHEVFRGTRPGLACALDPSKTNSPQLQSGCIDKPSLQAWPCPALPTGSARLLWGICRRGQGAGAALEQLALDVGGKQTRERPWRSNPPGPGDGRRLRGGKVARPSPHRDTALHGGQGGRPQTGAPYRGGEEQDAPAPLRGGASGCGRGSAPPSCGAAGGRRGGRC